MISAVGIKRILFDDIDKITADITPEIAKTLIQAASKRKMRFRTYMGKRGRLRRRKPPSLGTRTN